MNRVTAVLLLVVACFGHDDQRYDDDEAIALFADHLVPDANPSESYPFFDLAFCRPPSMVYKTQTLGEVLGGSRKVYYTNYKLHFKSNVPTTELCTLNLTPEDIAAFNESILHFWHFSMYFDEIPLKAYIGEYDQKGNVYLFTNHDFNFTYNRDRVIEAQIFTSPAHRVKLTPGESMKVRFTYSAQWSDTFVQFEDRTSSNPKEIFVEEIEIQWFSIINSFILVVLLTGFLAFITSRHLKKDFQRYDNEEPDETGWKLIHADVFRFPSHPSLFCSILGCGVQLLLIFVFMLTLSVVGVFYAHGRGTMYASIIVIYSLTAIASGYTSGSFYKKLGGEQWVHNVLLTCGLFVLPVFIIWSVLNSIAWAKGSTSALPAGTVFALFALFLLVAFPLTLAGAIFGKHTGDSLNAPCRTKQVPRQIPLAPWWRAPAYHIAVAGFLPFSAIYVELYYVYMSLWGHQLFTPYSVLFLVFGILLLVTACITVSLTYLQLSIEDHNWWWRSILSGGATGFFMYAYSFYYWVDESHMYGLLQLSFYFGYMLVICYAVFLMLGTVGFFASLSFVKQIYGSIKID
eukprot:TRINITY_DN2246_c1_g2_i1.p1 TRINITY_DN2246_c1_g2~~TRINITY_DN2246_c1_g2_i1.p1  ORF type:complete len:572 (+),score=88.54 TRINITY_DN2246_c1_g2_i1:41-1756(+)